MKNSLKDLTVNVKKSIDREYDGEFNMEPNFGKSQKVVNDQVISSIEDSYDDYDDFVVDLTTDEEELIEPNSANVDTIRLIKVKSVKELSEELENINKTKIPAIIDVKYIQERRVSEFKRLGNAIKTYKEETGGNVVLLGSTKNVLVATPKEVNLLR